MTDYATLQADIASLSMKTTLSTRIPTFIRLAEAEINRRVRVMEMQTRGLLTIDDTGSAALPARFKGFRSVALANAAGLSRDPTLNYMPPDPFFERKQSATGVGRDSYFTMEAGLLYVDPAPGAGQTFDVSASWWQGFEALSDDNPTNWLLTNHFDAYLNAAMAELCDHTKNLQDEAKYRTRFGGIVEDIHTEEKRKQRVGPHIRRPRTGTVV